MGVGSISFATLVKGLPATSGIGKTPTAIDAIKAYNIPTKIVATIITIGISLFWVFHFST